MRVPGGRLVGVSSASRGRGRGAVQDPVGAVAAVAVRDAVDDGMAAGEDDVDTVLHRPGSGRQAGEVERRQPLGRDGAAPGQIAGVAGPYLGKRGVADRRAIAVRTDDQVEALRTAAGVVPCAAALAAGVAVVEMQRGAVRELPTPSTRTPDRKTVSSGSRRRNSRQSGPQQYERKGKGRTASRRPSGAAPSRRYQRRSVSCTQGIVVSMYPAAASSAYRALCTARPTPRSARRPVVRSRMVIRPAPARCAASAVAQPAILPPTTATSAPAIWMRSVFIRRVPPALSGGRWSAGGLLSTGHILTGVVPSGRDPRGGAAGRPGGRGRAELDRQARAGQRARQAG